jgi:hypothetical protein
MSVCVCAWLLAAAPRPCEAQSSTAPVISGGALTPIRPPQTAEALESLPGELVRELDRLRPTTKPVGSRPASLPAEVEAAQQAATALYSAIQQLVGKIDLQITVRSAINALTSPKHAESFAKELAAVQEESRDLGAKLVEPPLNASAEDVKKATDEYEARNQQLTTWVALQTERAQRISREYVQAKSRYTDQTQTARTDVGDLVRRLKDADHAITSFLNVLGQDRSRMFWRHLLVPEPPIWSYRLAAIRQDWASEQEQRSQTLQALRLAMQQISRPRWVLLIVAVACVEILAIRVRRRTRRYADAILARLEETQVVEEEERASIADRVHLLSARFIGRTAILGWPAVTLMGFVGLYGVSNAVAMVLLVAFASVVAAVISEAIVHVLFLPGKPRQRLLRCSNVVAAHYRRWAMALWVVTIAFVPALLLLWALDWAYYTRTCLWTIYEAVALWVALLFGPRKELVLRLAGRPEQIRHQSIFGLLSGVYWLLWVAAAVLLVLDALGYVTLVTYVLSGLAETVVTVAVALLMARYVTALALRSRKVPPAGGPRKAGPRRRRRKRRPGAWSSG